MAKVILCGYMGCGKTVTANELSKITGLKSFDLDRIIEAQLKMPIAGIFADKGEIYFRKAERQWLVELLEMPGDSIISLGGGTPCYSNNHLLLNGPQVESFYLKTSPATLAARLAPIRNERPLLANIHTDELETFIAQHLFERSFYYGHCRNTVVTDGKSPKEVAIEIARMLA